MKTISDVEEVKCFKVEKPEEITAEYLYLDFLYFGTQVETVMICSLKGI